MISRRAIGLLILVLAVFAGAIYGGISAHAWWNGRQQLAQPGWCCIPERRSCIVEPSDDACTTAGGSVFTWDKATCASACFRPPAKKSSSL